MDIMIITYNVNFEWFDEMWEDMIKFSKEHLHHIFVPADNPKDSIFGLASWWNHPSPGIWMEEPDMHVKKFWEIKFKDLRKSCEYNRVPSNFHMPKNQTERLELARSIVSIAKET